jgi:hypothetical protein
MNQHIQKYITNSINCLREANEALFYAGVYLPKTEARDVDIKDRLAKVYQEISDMREGLLSLLSEPSVTLSEHEGIALRIRLTKAIQDLMDIRDVLSGKLDVKTG